MRGLGACSTSPGESSRELFARGNPEVPFTGGWGKSCLGGEVAAVLKKHK